MPLHGGCSSVLVLFGWFCIEREKDSGPTSTLSATMTYKDKNSKFKKYHSTLSVTLFHAKSQSLGFLE